MLKLIFVAYNLFVWGAYGWDKRLSKQPGARRTPERTLLLLAACMGGPGAAAGMRFFRHKTQKPRFAYGVPAMAMLQIVLLAWVWSRGWL